MGKPLLDECSSHVRAGFVKRVYALLALQLLLTGAITAGVVLSPDARAFVTRTPETIVAAGVVGLFVSCPLVAYRDRHPLNLLLLHLFTLCQSCVVAGVCAVYASAGAGLAVLEAFACTVGIFGALSLWVHVSRRDFAPLAPLLFAGLAALLMLGLVGVFVPSLFMQSAIAALGVVVFSGLVLYDTSLMLRTMTPDDTVLAVVQLYLDFVNLFLYLLQLLQTCSAND